MIILLLAGFPFLTGSAQFKVTVKGGVTAQLAPVYDMNYGNIRVEPERTTGFGYHFGLSGYFGNGTVFFQPEIQYESVSFDYIVIYEHARNIVKQEIDKLYFPMLVGIQFDIGRIYFGPSLSLRTEPPTPLISDPLFAKLYRKECLEYNVGFGVDVLKYIDIEIRYRAYLGKHYESIQKIGYQTITLNKSNSSILLTVGISLSPRSK